MCLEAAYTGNEEEALEWKAELEKHFDMEVHMDPLSLSVACITLDRVPLRWQFLKK